VSRVAIFIDGAYLGYLLKNEFALVRVDYEKLANQLAGGIDILRTYYYDCPPFQSSTPTQEEKDRFAKAQSFFSALDRLPRYEVRLGRLAHRGFNAAGKPDYQQKRVDIMLGVDLALLAGKRQITHAVLLAGDSDFIPAVAAAKSEGVLVRLYHGQSFHKDLWDCVDEREKITKTFIAAVKR
jgi:uncharacterized LabA/DUF88 family protein